jgi:hypothetical protein
MASMTSARLCGLNIPHLLVQHALGRHPSHRCARPNRERFLSLRSIPHWIASGAWRHPRRRPIHINLDAILDPVIPAPAARLRITGKTARTESSGSQHEGA